MRESTATTTARRGAPARNPTRYPTKGATALAPEREATAPRKAEVATPARERLRVAPPVPVSAPRAPFVALVLFVVVAGVLGILVLNTQITANAFQLAHLQRQQDGLDEREQQLNQKLADDNSPTNVAAKGRALGLVSVGQPAFMTLPNGAVIGVPQPAPGLPDAVGQQVARQPSAAPSASGAAASGRAASGQPGSGQAGPAASSPAAGR
jgi:cell division protein FtsB